MGNAEKFSKKLLVEGSDDQHVVWALCEKYKIQETFDVIDCKGINPLKVQIPIRFKQSGVNTVGIIIDADVDLNTRWQSIREILITIGFNIPNDLPSKGLIVENKIQKVGIWIMPDNNANGMLEDFIAFLVPQDDKLLPIAHSTLNELELKSLNPYATIHRSKALIHSWLAWQEDPGTPMGLSITKKYLTTDQAICQNLIDWLTELFKS